MNNLILASTIDNLIVETIYRTRIRSPDELRGFYFMACRYIDPDYFRTNQLTVASDIFAFGIVLLELITGQRVFDTTRLNGMNLTDWVVPRFKQGGVQEIIDPRLSGNYDASLFTHLTEVGLMCSNIDRTDRPTMKVNTRPGTPPLFKATCFFSS